MRLPFIIKSMAYLPGTFLHELAHYAAAQLLGKPEGFTVLPRREGNAVVFGRVTARVRYRVLSVFISAAPLIWWLAFVLLMEHLGIVLINWSLPDVHFTLSQERFKAFSLDGLFYLWLSVQLLWAGRLSVQDIKSLLAGLFCISGVVTALVVFFVYKLFGFS